MPTLIVEAAPAVLQDTVALHPPVQTSSFALSRTIGESTLIFVIAILAIAVNGYHPYSEDAGIYVAGIKQAAHPGLYGSSAVFITASSHLSQFSYLNVLLERSVSLSLDEQLFAMQILTTWLLLYACWRIAQRCFSSIEARWASVSLLAVSLSVPVAGSSLFLLDPYVTGRSFSMPLSVLAIYAVLDGKTLRAALLVGLVALFHPLMSIYTAGFLLLLWAIRKRSLIWTGSLMALEIAAAGIMQFSQRSVSESPAYRAAVATRLYFFLSYWRWYEVFGLVAPLVLFGLYCAWWRRHSDVEGRLAGKDDGLALARTCVAAGVTAVVVSLLFVRVQSHSHFIAAMQPMRAFVLIYLCMFLLLGGVLGELWLKRVLWLWALLFAVMAAGIAFVQHQSYPESGHLELPGTLNRNGWNEAFLWVRANTPRDAIFALDSDYIHAHGEDTQGFRAIAERGSLADFSKDGGAAAVFPQLAERWMTEQAAQTGLNAIDDGERQRRLVPLRVSWVILDRQTTTAMTCPFQDDLVKVCRLD